MRSGHGINLFSMARVKFKFVSLVVFSVTAHCEKFKDFYSKKNGEPGRLSTVQIPVQTTAGVIVPLAKWGTLVTEGFRLFLRFHYSCVQAELVNPLDSFIKLCIHTKLDEAMCHDQDRQLLHS